MTHSHLQKLINDKEARIAVVGLGYVGLPVAVLLADKGFDVLGVEIKTDRVDLINQGINPIEGKEPGLSAMIKSVVKKGDLRATTDFRNIAGCNLVLVNVETPVNDQNYPEYKALRTAVTSIGEHIKRGSLVVVESTIMPGTMQKVVKPLLEEFSGLKVGSDFYLGNCPERVMPGKLLENLENLSRVVGGDSKDTSAVMKEFYSHIVKADIDETDWITAEIVKTAENAYRDVQIAFANEVAIICEALGADVWEVRKLVRKSPGRNMLKPGAGVGGHCIPKDPWLLASSVKDLKVNLELIPAARKINTSMPNHLLSLLKEKLGNLNGKKILLLGYAYLEESDDTRNSPAAALGKLLEKAKAAVRIHDPFVSEFAGDILKIVKDCDAAVLVTAHSEYKDMDYKKIKRLMRNPLIVDGRNLLDRKTVRSAGIELITIGDKSSPE